MQLIFIFLSLIFFLFFMVLGIERSKIKTLDNLESCRFTLVLGAGLEKNHEPTDILKDRVEAALEIKKYKKTEYLIFSGSSGSNNYNEPQSMSSYAKKLGVPVENFILDCDGSTTLNSLMSFLKLKQKSLIIVTQKFHLPRALFLSRLLHLNAQGFSAYKFKFSVLKTTTWYLREIFALPYNLIKLFFHIYFNNKII